MNYIDCLKEVTDVFYHAHCGDGIAAALIVARVLPQAKFHAVMYGEAGYESLTPICNALFCDITPPKTNYMEWVAKEPIVLDHHIGAKSITTTFENGFYGDNSRYSGAVLAYEYVLLPMLSADRSFIDNGSSLAGTLKYWQRFAELTWIVDTWQQDHPDIKQALAHYTGINIVGFERLYQSIIGSSDPKKPKHLHDFDKMYEIAKTIGEITTENMEHEADEMLPGISTTTVSTLVGPPYKVAIFNQDRINGALVKKLRDQDFDLIIKWSVRNNVVEVSLRSGDRIDVMEIAKKFGGGGHKAAAGLRLPNGSSLSQDGVFEMILDKL